MFEPLQEPLAESPRTSHEISDVEGERQISRDSYNSISERQRPILPSHKHGKLIKVELKDELLPVGARGTLEAGSSVYQHRSEFADLNESPRSVTDLNKPLPTPPARASHESDRESVFDREAAGKTPEPPSPMSSSRRKTPPAPPLARRHSQSTSDSKSVRMKSRRMPGNTEDDSDAPGGVLLGVQANARAPPPPPSRRPQSLRQTSQTSSTSSLTPSSMDMEKSTVKTISAPPPPPTRTLSGRTSGRPPSISSMDMSSKRQAAMPPPPPPRQRASSKNSLDATVISPASSRASGEFRRSMDSGREGSTASHGTMPEPLTTKPATNILADITALQREIDALRGYSENKHTS